MGIDMQTTWILLRGLVREQAHWEGFAERLASALGDGHRVLVVIRHVRQWCPVRSPGHPLQRSLLTNHRRIPAGHDHRAVREGAGRV